LWTFQSNGNAASWTGGWDPTSKFFTLTPAESPSNTTGKLTEQIPDEETIKGNLTINDGGGETLLDVAWTRKRQAKAFGERAREQWSAIGTPAPPPPPLLRRIPPLPPSTCGHLRCLLKPSAAVSGKFYSPPQDAVHRTDTGQLDEYKYCISVHSVSTAFQRASAGS
jgi:hypothetical protein